MSGPLLVVLTGSSGAGKDAVLAHLKSLGRPYHFAVTATTRAARPHEKDGVDYDFVSVVEFERMIEQGELLEHAMVYGQHYGGPRKPIRDALAAGKDVLMRTDIQGARTIKALVPGTVTIFVAAPSDAELERRLRSRATDSDEQLAIRLRIAREEAQASEEFDYTVVNDDLAECAVEVEEILAREREKPGRKAIGL